MAIKAKYLPGVMNIKADRSDKLESNLHIRFLPFGMVGRVLRKKVQQD